MSGGGKRKLDDTGGDGAEARCMRDTHEEYFFKFASEEIKRYANAAMYGDVLCKTGPMYIPWDMVEKECAKAVGDDFLCELKAEMACDFEDTDTIKAELLAYVRQYVLLTGLANMARREAQERLPHLQVGEHAFEALRFKNSTLLRTHATELARTMRSRCLVQDADDEDEEEEEEEGEDEDEDDADDDDLDERSDEEGEGEGEEWDEEAHCKAEAEEAEERMKQDKIAPP